MEGRHGKNESKVYKSALSGFSERKWTLCRLILETDAATIAGHVSMRGADGEVPLSEQVLSKNAKHRFLLENATS